MNLLRGNNAEARELVAHCQARILAIQSTLSKPLLSERDSDMLRGRIAELNKIIDAVHNEGEVDE